MHPDVLKQRMILVDHYVVSEWTLKSELSERRLLPNLQAGATGLLDSKADVKSSNMDTYIVPLDQMVREIKNYVDLINFILFFCACWSTN